MPERFRLPFEAACRNGDLAKLREVTLGMLLSHSLEQLRDPGILSEARVRRSLERVRAEGTSGAPAARIRVQSRSTAVVTEIATDRLIGIDALHVPDRLAA